MQHADYVSAGVFSAWVAGQSDCKRRVFFGMGCGASRHGAVEAILPTQGDNSVEEGAPPKTPSQKTPDPKTIQTPGPRRSELTHGSRYVRCEIYLVLYLALTVQSKNM